MEKVSFSIICSNVPLLREFVARVLLSELCSWNKACFLDYVKPCQSSWQSNKVTEVPGQLQPSEARSEIAYFQIWHNWPFWHLLCQWLRASSGLFVIKRIKSNHNPPSFCSFSSQSISRLDFWDNVQVILNISSSKEGTTEDKNQHMIKLKKKSRRVLTSCKT